jgi:flavin-dependent dehydrogenase
VTPEVLVVGGGPVGLAVAIACRSRGLPVTVLEARVPPLDKACGEGVLPEGVAFLRDAGVELEGRGAPFAGIRWRDGRSTVEGRFPGQGGLGVRRTTLQDVLLARSEALGVDVRFGVRVRELVRGGAGFGVRTTAGSFEPRWLVAADGLASPLRRAAGLEGAPAQRRRLAVRRHFLVSAGGSDPSSAKPFVEVCWADGVEAYVTPLPNGLLGVALLWHEHAAAASPGGGGAPQGSGGGAPPSGGGGAPPSRGGGAPPSGGGKRFDALLERFPELRRRLARGEIASRDRGAGPLRRRARALVRDNLALVGDAAGYLDAITGEGLSLGFLQADALARALVCADLSRYPREVRTLRRLPDALTELCLLLSRFPALRARTLVALAREPRLFDRLLALHARETDAAAPLAARLLWRVATVRGAATR